MEAFLVSMLILLLTFGVIEGVKKYYQSQYKKTKHKISDVEIFKIMARANHFLTVTQLAAVSPLEKKEAKDRLMHLVMEGAVKSFNDGGIHSVYHLVGELPEDKVLPIAIEGLSNEQIIEVIKQHSDDYQITIPRLSVIFDLEIYEAKKVFLRLKKSKLISFLWKNGTIIYVIKGPLKASKATLKEAVSYSKLKIPTQERLKIPDADVLNVAIENKGKLTSALLCLKLKIPIGDAKLKLEELYEQGAFIMDVDEHNAIVEYHLRDRNLL